jgi:hypothetical protein
MRLLYSVSTLILEKQRDELIKTILDRRLHFESKKFISWFTRLKAAPIVLPNDKETDTDKNVPNCCNQSCRKICQIDFL